MKAKHLVSVNGSGVPTGISKKTGSDGNVADPVYGSYVKETSITMATPAHVSDVKGLHQANTITTITEEEPETTYASVDTSSGPDSVGLASPEVPISDVIASGAVTVVSTDVTSFSDPTQADVTAGSTSLSRSASVGEGYVETCDKSEIIPIISTRI